MSLFGILVMLGTNNFKMPMVIKLTIGITVNIGQIARHCTILVNFITTLLPLQIFVRVDSHFKQNSINLISNFICMLIYVGNVGSDTVFIICR